MSIEVMRQALEVLEQINQLSIGENAIALPGEIDAAMDNLRAAIEQAEKPVAWMYDFLDSDNRDNVIRNWVTQSYDDIKRENGFNVRPLYTVPQYDQTALELCEECGWKAIIPGDGCLVCARQNAKPVAWRWKEVKGEFVGDWVLTEIEPPPYVTESMPLYAAPRQWQGLTDEEIKAPIQRAMQHFGFDPTQYSLGGMATIGFLGLVKEIEAKLKEKNT